MAAVALLDPQKAAVTTDPMAALASRSGQMTSAAEALGVRLADISKQRAAQTKQFGEEAAALKFPKLELPPSPVPKQTDPTHIWGSAAMMLAIVGSLMTRQPLVTAMNAAAGVMNAYKKNDKEAADQAFQTWKVATDNAIKLNNYQVDAYKAALGDVERREKTATEASKAEQDEAVAQFTAQARAFGDETAVQVAQIHGLEAAQRLVAEREALGLRLQEAGPRMAENKTALDAITELQSRPEYMNATPIQRLKMQQELLHRTAPGTASAAAKATLQQIDKHQRAYLARIDADKKMLTDQMAAYKTSKGGQVANLTDDPVWARYSQQLQQIDQARVRVLQSYQQAREAVESRGGRSGGGGVPAGAPTATAADGRKVYYDASKGEWLPVS
jgi:hypothetical protein